jgi:hypothetical protein
LSHDVVFLIKKVVWVGRNEGYEASAEMINNREGTVFGLRPEIFLFFSGCFENMTRFGFLLFFLHNKNKEVIMKFMLTWRVHPDKRQAAFNAFTQMTSEDDRKDMGDKVKLIGRWHDLSQFRGVAICESDDAQAVASWALNWNNVLDLETVVVLDDAEARAVGKKKLEEATNLKTTIVSN